MVKGFHLFEALGALLRVLEGGDFLRSVLCDGRMYRERVYFSLRICVFHILFLHSPRGLTTV